MKLLDLRFIDGDVDKHIGIARNVIRFIAFNPLLMGSCVLPRENRVKYTQSDLKMIEERCGVKLVEYEGGYIIENWFDHCIYTLHRAVEDSNKIRRNRGLKELSLSEIDLSLDPKEKFIKQRISELEEEIETLKRKLK